jgi:hypothetical protein
VYLIGVTAHTELLLLIQMRWIRCKRSCHADLGVKQERAIDPIDNAHKVIALVLVVVVLADECNGWVDEVSFS